MPVTLGRSIQLNYPAQNRGLGLAEQASNPSYQGGEGRKSQAQGYREIMPRDIGMSSRTSLKLVFLKRFIFIFCV